MLVLLTLLTCVFGYIHPITTYKNKFVDSVTSKPFYIRGVDYQPGGSSGFQQWSDPLSDVDACSRDIYLFQLLGINTIRVYSINPDLNHDACMTMLAQAGIYLILDVNTPRTGESINRYEPWTTYNPDYLRHVFRVVEQFAWYNNTLAFFMGNEVVNDERSANVSPPYLRAVTRDLKDYIRLNSPRPIPVGYSAADDLNFRIDLAAYLTCGDEHSAVDFYGVNSYQWCGQQTFQSSGYDILVRDHKDFPVPLFLSEFGCNIVMPRIFQELEAIYAPPMANTFSGGLVYEYSQQVNNYGLVEIDELGTVRLRSDFEALRNKFDEVKLPPRFSAPLSPPDPLPRTKRPQCASSYRSLGEVTKIPESFGTEMIRNGVRGAHRGKLLVDAEPHITPHTIIDLKGHEMIAPIILPLYNITDPEESVKVFPTMVAERHRRFH